MKATFIDCPPFLHELYRGELAEIVPDLAINVGSPSANEAIRLLEGSAFALNDHTMMDRALLEACPSLRCIVFLGTGAASYIDLGAAERLGIRVRTYGGYGDQSVAEHALALMLAAGRGIARMDRDIRAGRFEPVNGIEFAGKTPRRGRHRRHRQGHGASGRRARHARARLEPQRRAGRPAGAARPSWTICWRARTWSRFI